MPKDTVDEYSAENLKNIAAQIRDVAITLEATAAQMERMEIAALTIKNARQRKDGMNDIQSFEAAAKAAIRRACEQRGDFALKKPETKKPETKKMGKK